MSRSKRRLAAAVTPLALVASAGIVWNASYSAFSSTTTNPNNNWTTGSVTLADDDAGTAMFTASNIKPGATGTKCIAVTSSGSLPSGVHLYGTSYAQTKALGTYVTITVEEGTGATFSSCTGFTGGTTLYTGTLDAFASAKTNYASGVGSWAPTGSGSETKAYRISYTFSSGAPDTTQAGSASMGFTWEAQNT